VSWPPLSRSVSQTAQYVELPSPHVSRWRVNSDVHRQSQWKDVLRRGRAEPQQSGPVSAWEPTPKHSQPDDKAAQPARSRPDARVRRSRNPAKHPELFNVAVTGSRSPCRPVGLGPARWRQPVYRGRGPSTIRRRGNLPAIGSLPQGLGRLDHRQSVCGRRWIVVSRHLSNVRCRPSRQQPMLR